MNSIFIFSLFLIFLGIFLIKGYKIKKNYLYCIFISTIILLFCINVESSILACKDGLILCFNAIVPTVFTFSVICNFLILYDGISMYSKLIGPLICKPLRLNPKCSFPIVASILCGYPLGAKYSSDLYELKQISFKEYNRLIKIASNAGPIFIIGAVGTSILGDIKYGYFLLISNFLSILFIAILTMPKNKQKYISETKEEIFKGINFGSAMNLSISNSIKTTLNVCGYVIAFSVFISFFKNSYFIFSSFNQLEKILSLSPNSLLGFFLGSIEMTNGCNLVGSSSLSIHLKLGIISFLLSFSGLSIIAQTYSFTSKNGIKLFSYIRSKLVQGIFSFFLSFTLSKLFFITEEVFSSEIEKATSTSNFILVAIITLIIPVILFRVKKLFHAS